MKTLRNLMFQFKLRQRYIKNFAKRALPLTNLLRKDTPFEWTSETQEAFDDIKKAILNPPVLALPDQNAELQITTDASSRGIGAVLEQKYPNSEVKPLYFFSKKLNPSQSKYNATVLEFFAIYTALNFFRPFLLGRKFKVFTDHKPLAGFLSNKNPSSKILRWKLALEEFNYDIHYIRGSLNSVADHISRCINITIALPDSKDLINMQHEDSVLSTIIQKIDQNDVSLQISNYFINGEGLLCHLSKRPSRSPRSNTTRKQVCIPHCLKAKILESVHSEYGRHLKFFKTYHRLSENFFWQNMYKDTKNFVRSCTICLSRKNAFKIPPAPHQPVEQSKEPGETCHMDIFGPLKTTPKGNSYVLSMIDAFTKYIHIVPLPDIRSSTISKAFFDSYIVHRGCPHKLVVDNQHILRVPNLLNFAESWAFIKDTYQVIPLTSTGG
ncbi:transposon Tf2-8 polyprotein [Trichonephila clavipes]|nr:transposon Tf2-8 polyprotein [Trichonephila clavipes]